MSWDDPLQGNPRYQSVRTLSKSARSFVQLAVDRTNGEQVAIKFTQRGWEASQNKYLLRELLIHQELSACHHPHIVELKEVFLTPVYLAAVMEHVEGQDLQEFLSVTGGRVSEALGRFLFQQLILALDFCHLRGKVSRGVKLANTLLQLAPGQLPLVKLADFGFSKDTSLHSAPQSQVGTALFVAPEVMHNFNNAPYDGAAVDVWAAGIVLFILLFGRHPFLRPEDIGLSEQQQMLALFTRTAASQFCLLPEEAMAITPSCADLLGHILQTNPKNRPKQCLPDGAPGMNALIPADSSAAHFSSTHAMNNLSDPQLKQAQACDVCYRYSMAQIQAHPWFKQCLPDGALGMNALILADSASRPLQLRQPPEAIAALVRHGQVLDPVVLAQRFAPQPHQHQQHQEPAPAAVSPVPISPAAAEMPAAAAAVSPGHSTGHHTSSGGAATVLMPPPAAAGAATAAGGQSPQQDHSWGAPPPVPPRNLGHCTSSSDKREQMLYKTQEQHLQQQGPQPPILVNMNESTSSSHGSFVAALQQQQQMQLLQQQQHMQMLSQQQQQQQQSPSPGYVSLLQEQPPPPQQQQQLSPEAQQQLWQMQERAAASGNSSGATTGDVAAAGGTSAVTTGCGTAPHAAAAAAANSSGGTTAAATMQNGLQPDLAALHIQQQQQQQGGEAAAAGAAAAAAPYMDRSLASFTRLNSDELAKLIPLDSFSAGIHASATAAAGAGSSARANGSLPMEIFASMNSLPHIPSILPSLRLDSLLNPEFNPLLSQQLSADYEQQHQQTMQQPVTADVAPVAAAASGQGGAAPASQQLTAGKHRLAVSSKPGQAVSAGTADGSPANPSTNGSRPGVAPASEEHDADVEIPEEYAAFLVDEEDIAAGGGDEAARIRRKRLLSNVGGDSSLNLDLRQLSDMLLGGEASREQLEEGSLWHKICRDMSFRERYSGGGTAPGPANGGLGGAAAASSVDEDIMQQLQGLRDMSITR